VTDLDNIASRGGRSFFFFASGNQHRGGRDQGQGTFDVHKNSIFKKKIAKTNSSRAR
jgi:hypothetical protein